MLRISSEPNIYQSFQETVSSYMKSNVDIGATLEDKIKSAQSEELSLKTIFFETDYLSSMSDFDKIMSQIGVWYLGKKKFSSISTKQIITNNINSIKLLKKDKTEDTQDKVNSIIKEFRRLNLEITKYSPINSAEKEKITKIISEENQEKLAEPDYQDIKWNLSENGIDLNNDVSIPTAHNPVTEEVNAYAKKLAKKNIDEATYNGLKVATISTSSALTGTIVGAALVGTIVAVAGSFASRKK